MNPEQALQIVTNISNICVQKGGILNKVEDAATLSAALSVLKIVIDEHRKLMLEKSSQETPQ